MASKSPAHEDERVGTSLSTLARAADFQSDLKIALKLPQSATTSVKAATEELLRGELSNSAQQRAAGLLGVSVDQGFATLSPLLAINQCQEYSDNPQTGLSKIKKLLKLNPKQHKRLSELMGSFHHISGALRSQYDSQQQRVQLVGEHIPVWKEIKSRVLYAVNHEKFGSGQVPVVPIVTIRFKLAGVDSEQTVMFQADASDIERLISALKTLQEKLKAANASVTSGEQVCLVGDTTTSTVSTKAPRRKRVSRSR